MRSHGFGGLVYDGEQQALLRDKIEVALTPKCRGLLVLFLENPGRLLSRQEITHRVWPDTAVTDNALSFQIAELRKALGQVLLPRPLTRPITGTPLKDAELLAWATQAVEALFGGGTPGGPSSASR